MTHSESEEDAHHCVVLPMRLRELALNRATILGDMVDTAFTALKTGRRLNEAAEMMSAGIPELKQALEQCAEWEYQARVRKQALDVMEMWRDMTSEQAIQVVESTILDLTMHTD